MSKRIKISDNLLYFIIWNLFRFIFFTLRRCKVEGIENIPQENVIIAPNHRSYIDPPLVGGACNMIVYYMAKKELFSIPILGYILPRINVFPVDRKLSDIGAIKTALKILKSSGPLVIFPEGRRQKEKFTGHSLKFGVGYLSCRSQKAVVPVYLKNTDAFFSLKPIKVIFGKAIYPPVNYTKSDYKTFSKKIMGELKNLSLQ